MVENTNVYSNQRVDLRARLWYLSPYGETENKAPMDHATTYMVVMESVP
jgi:hypothetical protein